MYYKTVKIFPDGIWNKAVAVTATGLEISGNWNEYEFRENVLKNINGFTKFIDER